jgi:hypothetical protein
MKKSLIAFLFTAILLACEKRSGVLFLEPQPNTAKDENAFRKNIQGKYLFPKDSSLVIINNNSVVKVITFKGRFAKSDIDSTYHVNVNDDNSILEALRKYSMEGYIIGDSIFAKSIIKDTLFYISEDNKLRMFRGYYFLNTKVNENSYSVLRLELFKRRYLKFSQIMPLDSLDYKYRAITPVQKIMHDSVMVQYNMRPTKKELKKLMKEEAFIEEDEVYIKTEN